MSRAQRAPRARATQVVNNYSGWRPEGPGPHEVAVAPASISPRDFFEQFVAQRRPCVVDGHPLDAAWKARRLRFLWGARRALRAGVRGASARCRPFFASLQHARFGCPLLRAQTVRAAA